MSAANTAVQPSAARGDRDGANGANGANGASGPGGPSGPGAGAEGGGLEEPPPFWSRWSRIYWFVAALLAAQTLAFWLLARWAS